MDPLSLISGASSLFGGGGGSAASAPAGPVTFGNSTSGAVGLSTGAMIGIAVAVAAVVGFVVYLVTRK